jgi:hypothetical protein
VWGLQSLQLLLDALHSRAGCLQGWLPPRLLLLL